MRSKSLRLENLRYHTLETGRTFNVGINFDNANVGARGTSSGRTWLGIRSHPGSGTVPDGHNWLDPLLSRSLRAISRQSGTHPFKGPPLHNTTRHLQNSTSRNASGSSSARSCSMLQ